MDNKLTPTNLVIWRIAAWCGPVFLIGLLVFWGLLAGYVPAPPQDWTAAQLMAKYTEHNTAIKVGMVAVLMLIPFYFVWSSLVSKVIQRIEGPSGVLSNVELVGGTVTAITGLLFSACWLVAAFRIADRTPQDVQLMHDLGWMFFDVTFMAPGAQMIAFGTLPFIDRREKPLFPRWLGWVTYAGAATFICIALLPFVKNGPFAWNGLLTYWLALGMFFVWMVLAMYFVFPAIRRIADEDGVVPATPVGTRTRYDELKGTAAP